MPRHAFLTVLLLLMTACQRDSGDGAPSRDAGRSPGAQRHEQRARRPATKIDTITIEGERRATELTLYDAELFTTYFPADEMLVKQSSSEDGMSVRFIANFAGKRQDAAFLQIYVPRDPTADFRVMYDLLLGSEGIARSNGWKIGPLRSEGPPPCSGARGSWRIDAKTRRLTQVGFACIGEHRGRGITVLALYPPDYSEGMGPRIDNILDNVRWEDDGGLLFDQVRTVKPDQ